MRVAQVSPRAFPAIGGVETALSELSSGLVEKGHTVTVFASSARAAVGGNSDLPFDLVRLKGLRVLPGRETTWVPLDLRSRMRAFDPDIIHVHGFRHYPFYLGLYLTRSYSVVATLHHFPNPPRLLQKVHDEFTLPRCGRFSGIIAVNDVEHEWLRELGVPPHRLFYIPHGVPKAFSRFSETNHRRSDGPGVQAIFAGRVAPEKNLKSVIRAVADAPMEIRRSFRFDIIGPDDGGLRGVIRLVRELRVEDCVRYLGPKYGPELVSAYRSADFFILPSLSEVSPLALVEASACGLPIVASNRIHTPLVVDQYNGLKIDPENAMDVLSAITTLVRDPSLRQTMGRRSLEIVREFDMNRTTERTIAVYRKAVGS